MAREDEPSKEEIARTQPWNIKDPDEKLAAYKNLVAYDTNVYNKLMQFPAVRETCRTQDGAEELIQRIGDEPLLLDSAITSGKPWAMQVMAVLSGQVQKRDESARLRAKQQAAELADSRKPPSMFSSAGRTKGHVAPKPPPPPEEEPEEIEEEEPPARTPAEAKERATAHFRGSRWDEAVGEYEAALALLNDDAEMDLDEGMRMMATLHANIGACRLEHSMALGRRVAPPRCETMR
jgi:hypothetical protein